MDEEIMEDPWTYELDDEVDLMIWTTKAGKSIHVTAMETSHIKNTIAMLKRNRWPGGEAFYMGNSVYAEDAVEAENRRNEGRDEEYGERIKVFEEEIERRKNNGS